MTLMDPTSTDASCLNEDEVIQFVLETLPDAEYHFVQAHAESCPGCAALLASAFETLESVQRFELGAKALERLEREWTTRQSLVHAARGGANALQAAMARAFAVEGELGGVLEGAGRALVARELAALERVPGPTSPARISSTTARATLRLAATDLEYRSFERIGALGQIEQIVRRAARDRRPALAAFERWKTGQLIRFDTPVSPTPLALTATHPIRFEYTPSEQPDYQLLVMESRRATGPFTIISFGGSRGWHRWGFRLTFDPLDERQALRRLGLSESEIELLWNAKTAEPQGLSSLLDVLIPCRYGSDAEGEDPIFAEPLSGGVDGELPGIPTAVAVWLR